MNFLQEKIPPLYSLPLLKGGWGRDFVVGVSVLVFFLLPLIGFAQGYVPLAPLPGQPAAYEANQSALPSYLATIYKLGIGAAGVLAVLMLVWGGFQYTTSEAIQGKSDAKGIIQNVLWGGAIVLGSWLLLVTINPRLVDIGLALQNLDAVRKQPSASSVSKQWNDTLNQKFIQIGNEARTARKTYEQKLQEAQKKEERINELDRKFREGDFSPEEIANLSVLQEEAAKLRQEVTTIKTQADIENRLAAAKANMQRNGLLALDTLKNFPFVASSDSQTATKVKALKDGIAQESMKKKQEVIALKKTLDPKYGDPQYDWGKDPDYKAIDDARKAQQEQIDQMAKEGIENAKKTKEQQSQVNPGNIRGRAGVL